MAVGPEPGRRRYIIRCRCCCRCCPPWQPRGRVLTEPSSYSRCQRAGRGVSRRSATYIAHTVPTLANAETYSVFQNLLTGRCLIWCRQPVPNRDIHVVVRNNLNAVRNISMQRCTAFGRPSQTVTFMSWCGFLRAAYCRGVQRLEFWVSCRGVDVAREKCPPPMQVLCHTLDVLEWLCVQRLGAGGYQAPPPVYVWPRLARRLHKKGP